MRVFLALAVGDGRNATALARIFHSNLEGDAQDPMNRGVQRGSNACLKGHGTQVWKPAIRQAWKPALPGFAIAWQIDYEISGLALAAHESENGLPRFAKWSVRLMIGIANFEPHGSQVRPIFSTLIYLDLP